MQTEMECKECGEWFEVSDDDIDHQVSCPDCKTLFVVDSDMDGLSLVRKEKKDDSNRQAEGSGE